MWITGETKKIMRAQGEHLLHALSEIEIWKNNRSSSANAELRLAMIIEKDARLPIKILRRSEQSPFFGA